MVDEPPEEIEAELASDVRPQLGVLACIAVGGAFGALGRYAVSRVIHVPTDSFPRATFVINLSGAFALGCFLAIVHERRWSAQFVRPLFAVGFLGAFTTFSTMTVETVTLIKDGHAGIGISYLLSSVAFGLALCALGIFIGRAAARPRAIGGT